MATITSGKVTDSFGAIFQIGVMGGEPYDVWAKAQNNTSAVMKVKVAATSNNKHDVKEYNVEPNKVFEVQVGKVFGMVGNTLVVIQPSSPAICTFDHRPK